MLSRAWLEVSLGAVVRNARTLGERAGVPLIPMIKADAYGLGAIRVAKALEQVDPMAFGVATVEEGKELRDAGITRQIIVFTPLLESELETAHAAGLTPTLGTRSAIEAWAKYESPWDLSIDTGMARAGVPWREITSLIDLIERYPPAGAFTHFHSPDRVDMMDEQETRFRDAISLLPRRPRVLHTESSAAIVRHEKSLWDAVRPGIFMYGVGSGRGADLEPEGVVCMRARIVETRWLEPGDTVSYEATWTAPSRRSIATIPIGYADGYPRNAGGAGSGVVRGRAVPIVGRVTMDMIMVDVTDTGAVTGDVVTMIGDGSGARASIDVASVAAIAGMSPYELLTGLRGRLHRTYED